MREVDFESVINYYERLVRQEIRQTLGQSALADTPGALEDICCLALNQLPPRYVRHAIDTAFYISVEEQQQMIQTVRDAVTRAARYVADNPRTPLTGALPIGELPA